MSLQQGKIESRQVSRRVQQTKKEIEQLKAELQKLITRGINHNDDTNNAQFKPEDQITKQIPSITSTAQATLLVNKSTHSALQEKDFAKITFRPHLVKTPQKSLSKEPEPRKKERHYNVEEAREYIKKQKEKRVGMLKSQVKQSKNDNDLRKEKLKELQAKSLQLVKKNIEKKREKSKSRENLTSKCTSNVIPPISAALSENHFDANGCLVPDLIVNNIKHIEEKCSQLPMHENKNKKIRHVRTIHPHLENVTVRTYDLDLEAIPKLQSPKQSPKYDFRHNAASVKIQAAYRGYRQRKLYKAAIKIKRILEEDARKLAEEAVKRQAAQKDEMVVTKNCKTEIPFWLETVAKPHPYNFVSAVKRKLNFSFNPSMKTYSDVAVQSSEHLLPQTTRNKHQIKIGNSVKIAESNASFLSHKHLDLNLKNVQELQLQIKSDVNGCDIKESSSTSKTKSSKLTVNASESSGSDTSKNIPDISSESINNLCSSNAGHSNSDINLGINVDRLKDFKLSVDNDKRNIPVQDDLNVKHLLDRNEAIKKFEQFASTKQNSISLEYFKNSKSNGIPENFCNSQFKRDSDVENESHSSKHSAKSAPSSSLESQIRLKQNFDDKIWNSYNSIKSKINQERANSDGSKKSGSKKSNHSYNPGQVPESFKSLLNTVSKSPDSARPSKQAVNSEANNYSSNFSNASSSVPSLKRPTDTLTTSRHSLAEKHGVEKNVISVRPGEVTCFETKTNTNQIHLKFEAELHLLNDFNESLRKFMAVEQSLLELQAKTQNNNTTVYHHQDTQTSAPLQSESELRETHTVEKLIPTINYSRGSEVIEGYNLGDSFLHPAEKTLLTTGLDLSETEESAISTVHETKVLGNDSYGSNVFAGLSLGMFDQLIKDEDSRIENLKTILKIREKALLDRTKGELAWLEIQKKQLIETGQLHEASLLKKKQRGIVIKLQHEKQEMQRLKQMQKAASKERKIILKEQRNMIKAQLSSGNVITRIKKTVHKDRTRAGPVKVYNLHRETVNTETSVSKRNSATEELIITSRSESTVSRISDCAGDFECFNHDSTMKRHFSHRTEHTKRFLLMREAALQKRKKAAEDLLQWHQRLLEEERKIAELEMAANTIINQVPVDNMKEKYTGKDGQLNSLWLNMKEVDPQITLEQIHKKHSKNLINSKLNDSLDKSAINNKISDSTETPHTEILSDANSNSIIKSESTIKSVEIGNSFLNKSTTDDPINTNQSSINYTSEFESPEEKTSPTRPDVLENEIDKSKSTLHEIMQNISNITDEISAIYKLSCANTSKNDDESHAKGDDNDNNNTQDSISFSAGETSILSNESNNLQSQIVKSLSELIKTQSPCQDIRSLRERSIIETPEAVEPKNKLNESQNTLASSSELQTNLLKVETEESNKNETVNIIDTEAQGDKQNNVESEEKMVSLVHNHIDDFKQINDDYQNEQTVISDLSSLNNVSINNTETPTNSVKSSQVILDLSYGFVSCKKKNSENVVETSSTINLSDNTLNNLFKIDSTSIIRSINEPSSIKDNTEVPECLSLDFTEKPREIIISNDDLHTLNDSHSLETEINEKEEESCKANDLLNDLAETEEIINDFEMPQHESSLIEERTQLNSSENEIVKSVELISKNDSIQTENVNAEESVNIEEEDDISSSKTKSVNQKKNFTEGVIDVKKRVSEILADANSSSPREDKSPRLQDIYTTTYDITSPDHSPDSGSPVDADHNLLSVTQLYGEEAEALFKKQLAIEQEIKQLEQQQKEQIPYLYLREIPNKPPPPYTPPSSQIQNTHSVLPHSVEQIDILTENITDILYEAYSAGYLQSSCAPQNITLFLNKNNINKECYEFVFDLCKELAVHHYKQFVKDDKPSWLKIIKKSQLAKNEPYDKLGLRQYLDKRIKEILGFEKVQFKENAIIKWSRKKRDHVDELLVLESQVEESEWTNYDEDEVIVKNEVTNDIMNMLLQETANVMSTILRKRTFLY